MLVYNAEWLCTNKNVLAQLISNTLFNAHPYKHYLYINCLTYLCINYLFKLCYNLKNQCTNKPSTFVIRFNESRGHVLRVKH